MLRQSWSNGVGLQIIWRGIQLSAIASLYAAGLLGSWKQPAQAAEQFGNSAIQFDVDTIVEFEFVASHGAFQSTFGVLNLDTGEKTPLISEIKPSDSNDPMINKKTDFLGTPGNAVPQPLAEFQFKAHTRYLFYLESLYNNRPAGIIYSTNTRNPNSNQQAEFAGGLSGLANGGTLINWDDTGIVKKTPQEKDFNDFTVRVGGHLACPYRISGRSMVVSCTGNSH